MSHKSMEQEMLPELELIESEKHSSDEKVIKMHKDILGLQAESDLILFNHIPEIVQKLDRVASDIVIIRDDYGDTNRLVRKMYYDMIPSLHTKIDEMSLKINNIYLKLEELLKK